MDIGILGSILGDKKRRETVVAPMDIGILGGTFDPIHKGHIHIAEAALNEYGLGSIWLMPAGDPYFKADTGVSETKLRLEMVNICLRELPDNFECCDIETRVIGETHTADTLSILKELYPDHRFFFITGLDTLRQIPAWYKPDLVFKNATILCASRESVSYPDELVHAIVEIKDRFFEAEPDIRIIHTPELDISSTKIRSMVRNGEDISGLVTSEVYDFIKSHGLYKA